MPCETYWILGSEVPGSLFLCMVGSDYQGVTRAHRLGRSVAREIKS